MRTTARPKRHGRLLGQAAVWATVASLLAACGESAAGAPPRPTGSPTVTSCYAYQRNPVELPRSTMRTFYPECGKARDQG